LKKKILDLDAIITPYTAVLVLFGVLCVDGEKDFVETSSRVFTKQNPPESRVEDRQSRLGIQ